MISRDLAAAALAILVSACGSVAPARDVQCSAGSVEVLQNRNGSFDGTPPWTQDPAATTLICMAPRVAPIDGTQAACLGGTDGTVHTLTQTVPLPDGAVSVKLTGQMCADTTETQAADHDILTIDLLDGTTTVAAIARVTNQQGTSGCALHPFEQTATLTGDPVAATLRIRSTLDADMPTSFYLDALRLTVTCQ